MAAINAAVVGILLAALYDPVWTSAIHTRAYFAVALAAFALLVYARMSPLLVVLLAAAAGWVFLVKPAAARALSDHFRPGPCRRRRTTRCR